MMRLFPIQANTSNNKYGKVREEVYMKAYEVYCALYGEQKALIDFERGCRGGFGVSELVVYLYAASFPKNEWKRRVNEASEGINLD